MTPEERRQKRTHFIKTAKDMGVPVSEVKDILEQKKRPGDYYDIKAGKVPEFMIEEKMHPKINELTRVGIKNLSDEGEETMFALRKNLPSYMDIREQDGRYLIRDGSRGEDRFKVLDPQIVQFTAPIDSARRIADDPAEFGKETIREAGDLTPTIAKGALAAYASSKGAKGVTYKLVGRDLGGWGVKGMAGLTGATTMYPLEYARQLLGKHLGFRKEISHTRAAAEGIIEGVAPFLTGTTLAKSEVLKVFAKEDAKRLVKQLPSNWAGRRMKQAIKDIKLARNAKKIEHSGMNKFVQQFPEAEAGRSARKMAELEGINMQKGLLNWGYDKITRGGGPLAAQIFSGADKEAFKMYAKHWDQMKSVARAPYEFAGNVGRKIKSYVKDSKSLNGKALGEFRDSYATREFDINATKRVFKKQIEELEAKEAIGTIASHELEYLKELRNAYKNAFFRKQKKLVIEKVPRPSQKKILRGEFGDKTRKVLEDDWVEIGTPGGKPVTLADYKEIREPIKVLSNYFTYKNAPSDAETRVINLANEAYWALENDTKNTLTKYGGSRVANTYQQLVDKYRDSIAMEKFMGSIFTRHPTRDRYNFDAQAYNNLVNSGTAVSEQFKKILANFDDQREFNNRLGRTARGFLEETEMLFAHNQIGSVGRGVKGSKFQISNVPGREVGRLSAIAGGLDPRAAGSAMSLGLGLVEPSNAAKVLNKVYNAEKFMGLPFRKFPGRKQIEQVKGKLPSAVTKRLPSQLGRRITEGTRRRLPLQHTSPWFDENIIQGIQESWTDDKRR